MKKNKVLQIWNGRAQGVKRGTFYVAAYTQKEAAELIAKAGGQIGRASVNEIREYYSKGLWGTPMDGITPTEPCVYWQEMYEKPKRIL